MQVSQTHKLTTVPSQSALPSSLASVAEAPFSQTCIRIQRANLSSMLYRLKPTKIGAEDSPIKPPTPTPTAGKQPTCIFG